ncbi:putative multidrug export ATP-binding/permease protein [Marinobacterium sp. xm-g-59]|uniref:ABCB family ABC transporter ATP-binding protein/permease n=1 Tax=Marinobacterium sp. xm-g-59 TaxID=2497748 RepID=UPI0019DD7CD2|nr:ABC transporter ATP-binding protein/permease [Marinobacterium sp. xm-g-59]NRP94974.1 putative multidrug export ATP-binding/permease protein [Marinobacterium sp. xm-g-59]
MSRHGGGRHYKSDSNSSNTVGMGEAWSVIKMIWPYLWEYRRRMAVAFLMLISAKLAVVAMPLALKQIVDGLDASLNPLITVPVAMVVAYGMLRFGSVFFAEARDAVFSRVTERAMRRMVLKVFRHLHSLELDFHLSRQTGGISRDIDRGSNGFSFLMRMMVFNIVPTLIEISLVAAILLFNFSVWYALVVVVCVGIYIYFTILTTEWRNRYVRETNQLDSQANTRAIDSLLNYETVKYFGNEEYEASQYDKNLASWETARLKTRMTLMILNSGQAFIISLGIILMLWLAAEDVASGAMTLGSLVMINAYILQLFMPLNFLGMVYREVRKALTDIENMFGLLKKQPKIVDRPEASDLKAQGGAICFDSVNFAYHPDRQILKGVSFKVEAGKKVAIVGPSGSGKSTLARLLFRFYDVQSGQICIDGQPIDQVTQHSLRQAIGVVPQDTVLFNDTIYNNVAYGRPGSSREEVLKAIELANLNDFIAALPEGVDTLVGERGLKVSGGEKQRIAIARVILKRPPILLFDEATSALDSDNEQAILNAFTSLSKNHTSLVIAHRLSTIIDADNILVMRKGEVVEQGTHTELLAQQGVYAGMWSLQQQ